MMPIDDRELLLRIANGDEAAMQQLYSCYRPRLRRYLWYRLDHDPERVDDVLQETFLSIWRFAGSFRGASSVTVWIFRIAMRCSLEAHRTDSRRPDGHAAPLADDDHQTDSPEEAVLARLSLGEAMRMLSLKHREVLYLIFLQGFTPEEVAQILEVPLGTVKSRISYARRALHVALRRAQAEDAH